MTASAVGHGLFRVIKAARSMPRNAAEQIGVIMILPAQELLVLAQFLRDADFMTGRTKLSAPHEGLEERLLMKFGLGLDQLLIEVLKSRVSAVCERIVQRFIDGVIRVSPGAVDPGDCMAGG